MKKDTTKTFCILPFMHLYTQPDGEVKPCCIADGFDNKQSLQKKTIEQVYNSEEFKQLRKDMLNGKRHKVCDVCYKKEDAGEESPRKFFNSVHENGLWTLPVINEDYSVSLEFQHIDIRFSNLCNFKCRMCNHTFSSHWYEDSLKVNNDGHYLHSSGQNKKVIQASETIIEDLTPHLSNIKSVYFAGGEPLINDQHYELLTWLYDNVEDGHLKLHYNTNLSTLKYKKYNFIKYWKSFDKVHLSISCDGIGDVGEYQRVGFNHDTFIENLNEIKKHAVPMATSVPADGFSYNFQYTTTIFNIEHIFDFIDFMLENEYVDSTDCIDFYYTWGPDYMSINNIPDVDKFRLTKLFSKKIETLTSEKTKNELNAIINYMNSNSSTPHAITSSLIGQLDKINNTDYKKITTLRF